MSQSFEERVHRLQDGRCPVRGIPQRRRSDWLCPLGRRWFDDHENCDCRPSAKRWRRVGCPRSDCGILAREWSLVLWGGPYELETSWDALPDGWPEAGGPVALEGSRTALPDREQGDR